MGTSPHFDIDLKRGEVGENTHNAFLTGKHEVKTDYRIHETGNCYVEIYQYNDMGKWPSGISITESEWWVQASPTGEGALYIRTETLKNLITRNWGIYPVRSQPIRNENTNSSDGVLVPLVDILRELKMHA